MTDTHRTYWDEIDFAAIARDHPIGDPFVKLVTSISLTRGVRQVGSGPDG